MSAKQYFKRGLTCGADMEVRNGGVDLSVTASTSGSTIVSYGYQTITGSSSTNTFTLAAPVAGRDMYLHCTNASSGAQALVTLAAGVSFYSSNSTAATLRTAKFADSNDVLHLFGASTSKWTIIANTGSVAISTT